MLNQGSGDTIWEGKTAAGARSAFESAIALNGRHGGAWRGLGFVQFIGDTQAEALASWAQTSDMAVEMGAWARRAENEGRPVTADDRYLLAIALDPGWADPWYFHALFLETKGEQGAARAAYQRGLNAPYRLDVGRSDFYFRLARLAVAERDPEWAAAERLFDQAIQLQEFSHHVTAAQAFYGRGEARRWTHQPRAAMADFETTLSLQPDHYWARVQLGALVWENDGDAGRAEMLWLEAIELNPDLKWPYRNLGDMYVELNRATAAIAAYEQVLALDSTDLGAQSALSKLRDPHRN